MDYKEKLRLAKEALDSGSYDKETIEYIFPELAESEEEKIRKELLVWLKSKDGQTLPIDRYNAAIAWLEKQGEQKPANWLQELEDKLANATPQQLAEWKEKYFKEEPAEWSEEDNKMIKELIKNQEILIDSTTDEHLRYLYSTEIIWLKSLKNKIILQPQQECSVKDKKKLDSIIVYLTKEIEENGLIALHGIPIGELLSWLKSLKDRVQPKPKQEWSEEDEIIVDVLYAYAEKANQNGCPNDAKRIEAAINKLKSLRHQSTWKPSEEEMKALEFCLEHNIDKDGVFGSKVVKLYDELKKLR